MTKHGLSLAERFWPKVDVRGPDECWPWTAKSRQQGGYGAIRVDGRIERAHRVAYRLTYGELPDGVVVRHRCDNPPCCNPADLVTGTQLDNIRDMHDRGRASGGRLHRPGEAGPNAKLTAAQVAALRQRRADGATVRVVAAEFGISISQVSRICTGKRWAGC